MFTEPQWTHAFGLRHCLQEAPVELSTNFQEHYPERDEDRHITTSMEREGLSSGFEVSLQTTARVAVFESPRELPPHEIPVKLCK